ncbi:ubiquinol cytochrome C oxidoreductase [Ruegeria arenilitoris]|uniref:ubiquinol cytochrome C oxidoreductase n=1 Tax=Ruegeria arenilitoris TaxID=1173585 RepID=UPI00147F4AA1|nr:ubiquinol cytochrome C oxidoreductase [Ruegeria arenilitoris]
MKKKGVFLYRVTAVWALLTAATGLYFLFSSTRPTADVVAYYKNSPGTVQVKSWAPGDARLLNIKGRPVLIWRRNLAEMATAMHQFDPSIALEEWSEVLSNGALEQELGPERFARLVWFVVSPISTAGLECIVLTKAGDFDGYFDPCRGAHYDMWGRSRKGPTNENLKVPRYKIDEQAQIIVIDVSRLPSPR